MRQHSINGMGGRPRWRSAAPRVLSGRDTAAGHILAGTLPGPVRSRGRVARGVIQNWSHVLAVAPGQPVVSYVGYSLKEPWGEPRVVIGIDADEAEYLAEFLDRDECAQRGQAQLQQAQLQQAQLQQVPAQQPSLQQAQLQQVPLQAGPLQSGPIQQVRLPEAAPEGTGE